MCTFSSIVQEEALLTQVVESCHCGGQSMGVRMQEVTSRPLARKCNNLHVTDDHWRGQHLSSACHPRPM